MSQEAIPLPVFAPAVPTFFVSAPVLAHRESEPGVH